MDMVSSLLLENNLLSEIKTLVLTTGTLYKIYKHELSEWQENKLVKKLRTQDTHCLFFSHISTNNQRIINKALRISFPITYLAVGKNEGN